MGLTTFNDKFPICAQDFHYFAEFFFLKLNRNSEDCEMVITETET